MLARPVVARREAPRARDRRRAPRGTAPAPPGRSGRARRSSRRAAYSTPRNTLRAHGCPGALGGGAGVQRGRGHRDHPRARCTPRSTGSGSGTRSSSSTTPAATARRTSSRRSAIHSCACCATRRTSARADRCGAGCWRRAGSCGCTATPTAVRRCDALGRMLELSGRLRRRRRLAAGRGRGGRAAPAAAAPDRGAQLRAALPRGAARAHARPVLRLQAVARGGRRGGLPRDAR